MENSFLDSCLKVFGLTENQVNQSLRFMQSHSRSCPKINKEDREFVETEEQATIQSTYGYSFVDNGIGYSAKVFCDLCGESDEIYMSEHEMDEFPA